MTYREVTDYLFRKAPSFQKVGQQGYKEGLANTLALDDHFGHPHRNYKTIHIAGTNGKGSCAHTTAAILQSAGYRVGLYTSPHLVDFRERIRVDGVMIPEDYVVMFVEVNRSMIESMELSFFEVTTALAFKYFCDSNVDIAVIEVGLGGRLDCTNIITPLLSAITNISFDHMQFLGHSLAAIAAEKAGIIKSGVPVVIGEATGVTRPVFQAKADEMASPILFAEDDNHVIASEENCLQGGRDYDIKGIGRLHGVLGGLCQEKNTNTILHVVDQLRKRGIGIPQEAVRAGFENVTSLTGLQGRWQKLGERPIVVCDTSHNVGGFEYIVRQIENQKFHRLHMVFGMVGDKDIAAILALLPRDAVYYFTQASIQRALDCESLARLAAPYQLQGRCFPTVAEAYASACQAAEADDMVYVGGSSFVVADLLAHLQGCGVS